MDCSIYWTSHVLQGTRKTRPCVTDDPVGLALVWLYCVNPICNPLGMPISFNKQGRNSGLAEDPCYRVGMSGNIFFLKISLISVFISRNFACLILLYFTNTKSYKYVVQQKTKLLKIKFISIHVTYSDLLQTEECTNTKHIVRLLFPMWAQNNVARYTV